jgi:hypothetical protein
MVNVSLSGAFVQTTLKVPVLSRVQLVIAPDLDDSLAGAHIDGLIVRQTEAGLGLEWSEFAGAKIQTLLTHVASADLSWVSLPKKKPPRRAREKRS